MAIWQPLIVCDGVKTTELPECDFAALITLVKVLINDLVFISTFLAVIVFCYAGFTLLTSGGKPGALEDAKKMLWKVMLGYMWILAAWLVVYTITSILLKDGYSLLGAPTPN